MDDPADPTFNRLLGINNEGRIVGYYGAGSPSDPSEGFLAYPPYAPNNYRSVIYPKAADTQSTGLNNRKTTAGFYMTPKGKILSFIYTGGIWWSYQDQHARGARTATEILSLNDSDVAVGFYKSRSQTGSFELNVATGDFDGFNPPLGSNAIATGINGGGDVVGYLTQKSIVVGFLRKNGTYYYFSYPGSTSTEFLGVTAHDRIVGFYLDGKGATHGFLLLSPTWKKGTSWQSIDDPNGVGTTVATSVNIHDVIVGYYVDASNVTHGFLATPSSGQ
jgi:hypothetical protein